MNGVIVTVASLHNATVIPNVSGKGAALFSARTLLHTDIEIHPRYAGGGRTHAGPDIPADALPAGTTFDTNGLSDQNGEPKGPVATYPVPAGRLKDMQERAKSLGLVPP